MSFDLAVPVGVPGSGAAKTTLDIATVVHSFRRY
jgi:hypothetical protein